MVEEALRFQALELSKAQRDYDELYEKFNQVAAHSASLQRLNDSLNRVNSDLKERLTVQRRKRKEKEKEYRDDVAQLQQAESLLTKKEEEVEEVLRDLKRRNAGLETLNQQLVEDNERYRGKVANDFVPLDIHRNIVSSKDAEIRVLEMRITEEYVSKEEYAILQKEVQRLEASMVDVRRDSDGKTEALNAVKSQYYEVSVRRSSLEDDITQLQDEKRSLTERNIEVQAMLQRLQGDLDGSEDARRKGVDVINELEKAKSALLVQVGNLKQRTHREVGALQTEHDDMKVLYEDSEKRRRYLEGAIQSFEDETAAMQTRTQMLMLERDRLAEKGNELGKKVNTLQEELKDKNNICAKFNGQKIKMETSIAKLLKERDEERTALRKAEKAKAGVESVCEELFAQKTAAQAAAIAFEGEVRRLRLAFIELEGVKDGLETTQDDLAEDNQSLCDQMETLKANYEEKNSRCLELESQRCAALQQCEQLYDARVAFEARFTTLKLDNLSTHRKLVDMSTELALLKARLSTCTCGNSGNTASQSRPICADSEGARSKVHGAHGRIDKVGITASPSPEVRMNIRERSDTRTPVPESAYVMRYDGYATPQSAVRGTNLLYARRSGSPHTCAETAPSGCGNVLGSGVYGNAKGKNIAIYSDEVAQFHGESSYGSKSVSTVNLTQPIGQEINKCSPINSITSSLQISPSKVEESQDNEDEQAAGELSLRSLGSLRAYMMTRQEHHRAMLVAREREISSAKSYVGPATTDSAISGGSGAGKQRPGSGVLTPTKTWYDIDGRVRRASEIYDGSDLVASSSSASSFGDMQNNSGRASVGDVESSFDWISPCTTGGESLGLGLGLGLGRLDVSSGMASIQMGEEVPSMSGTARGQPMKVKDPHTGSCNVATQPEYEPIPPVEKVYDDGFHETDGGRPECVPPLEGNPTRIPSHQCANQGHLTGAHSPKGNMLKVSDTSAVVGRKLISPRHAVGEAPVFALTALPVAASHQ